MSMIVLCVTGSIAAIESVKLARELKRRGFDVKCFMSDDACKIIHPYAMEFATKKKVVLELTGKVEHVKYAGAEAIVVAPATANIISKFACKIADNPINTLLLAACGANTPIIFVPAMNEHMYKAIKDKIEEIDKKYENVTFVDPKIEDGKAKFPDIEDIVLNVFRKISPRILEGKRVLITAGGTYEPIDPIRGISNLSSGKMGVELAKEAFIQGADVTLLIGRVEEIIPKSINKIKALSTEEMLDKIKDIVRDYDVFISVGAISDFKPYKYYEKKISSSKPIELKLIPNPKVINEVKKINPNIYLVGFKAEYNVTKEELINSAKKLKRESNADMVVANDVSKNGFGSSKIEATIINKDIEEFPLMEKSKLAKIIIEKIGKELNEV